MNSVLQLQNHGCNKSPSATSSNVPHREKAGRHIWGPKGQGLSVSHIKDSLVALKGLYMNSL